MCSCRCPVHRPPLRAPRLLMTRQCTVQSPTPVTLLTSAMALVNFVHDGYVHQRHRVAFVCLVLIIFDKLAVQLGLFQRMRLRRDASRTSQAVLRSDAAVAAVGSSGAGSHRVTSSDRVHFALRSIDGQTSGLPCAQITVGCRRRVLAGRRRRLARVARRRYGAGR